MKKSFLLLIIILIPVVIITGCGNEQPEEEASQQVGDTETTEITGDAVELTVSEEGQENVINKKEYYVSPFTGRAIGEKSLNRAVMVSIENSPAARPQSGLEDADIIYEFLVEGGITRFLALYWNNIPEKIGPVRSLRPYLIATAHEYNPLLLHAGASPAGFNMLSEVDINNLDQIYKGKYYWRDGDRKRPHNLYTGYFKINSYLNEITGQEYSNRFSFQQIKLMVEKDLNAKNINVDYWGNYNVIYQYVAERNIYKRFLYDHEQPHLVENGEQLTAKNIIVQFVETQVKDDEGRLTMELDGKGEILVFRDGTVIRGYWEKEKDKLTKYYNDKAQEIKLNPGQTWIQVVPRFTAIDYGSGDNNEQRAQEEINNSR